MHSLNYAQMVVEFRAARHFCWARPWWTPIDQDIVLLML